MKNYKHSKIAKKVSEKTGYSPALVTVVIAGFFDGIRNLLKKNKNIKIKGLFSFYMHSYYRKILEKKGEDYNLRKRKNY
jgi:nucleoid DNA-binding protein